MTHPPASRMIAALLLAISALAFVIGVAAERSAEDDEETHQDAVSTATVVEATATQSEAGESGEEAEEHDEEAEARETSERTEGTPVTEENHTEEGETGGKAEAHSGESEDILGINPESTGAVAVAVTISLLLGLAVWLWGTPVILATAVAFGLVLAGLDVREAFHQADESRGGLVALALLIAALHVGVAIAAGAALKERRASASPVA
jgi:uncharacterized membrane protein YdbT with pleckstrin-like domain